MRTNFYNILATAQHGHLLTPFMRYQRNHPADLPLKVFINFSIVDACLRSHSNLVHTWNLLSPTDSRVYEKGFALLQDEEWKIQTSCETCSPVPMMLPKNFTSLVKQMSKKLRDSFCKLILGCLLMKVCHPNSGKIMIYHFCNSA